MKKNLRLILVLTLGLIVMMFAVACDDDDDDDDPVETIVDKIDGDWLSAGDDLSWYSSDYFFYDSVKVTFNDDLTVVLETRTADGWDEPLNGTYEIDLESGVNEVYPIEIDYSAFAQEGIIQLNEGTPDKITLEVVLAGAGLTVPNPEDGFGSDTLNVQYYKRVN